MADQTSYEGRIKRLELQNADLVRRLADINAMARKAYEDSSRGYQRSGQQTDFRRAIVTTAITAPSSATATHTLAAGWGFAQLQYYDVTLNKYANLGDPVVVIQPYPGIATIAVGKIIQVFFNGNVYEWNNGLCPTT